MTRPSILFALVIGLGGCTEILGKDYRVIEPRRPTQASPVDSDGSVGPATEVTGDQDGSTPFEQDAMGNDGSAGEWDQDASQDIERSLGTDVLDGVGGAGGIGNVDSSTERDGTAVTDGSAETGGAGGSGGTAGGNQDGADARSTGRAGRGGGKT